MLRSESNAPLMAPRALQTPWLLQSQHLSQCVVISCFLSTVFLRVGNVFFFFNNILLFDLRASQVVAETVKNLPAMQETRV